MLFHHLAYDNADSGGDTSTDSVRALARYTSGLT